MLESRLTGFMALEQITLLTGGASREMHWLRVRTGNGSEEFALRRSRGPGQKSPGVTGLLAEARLTDLAFASGIPSPKVSFVFKEDDPDNPGLGDGFVMAWIDGETIGSRIVRSPELAPARERMAAQCGEILARLHAIDVDRNGLRDLLPTFTPSELVESTYSDYLKLDEPVPMIDFAAHWLRRNLPEPVPERLVHGDFRNGNLIVDPDGVAAVLDWETSCLGDPMRDLAWICVNSWRYGQSDKPVGGFGQLSDLTQAYEKESGESVSRTSFDFWHVFGVFWWAKTTLLLGSSYRQGTVKAPDRVVIGRRCSEAEIDLVNLLIPGPVNEPPSPKRPLEQLASSYELVESVRDSVERDLLQHLKGPEKFLARVAVRNLSLVLREKEMGREANQREVEQLLSLLGLPSQDLRDLRNALCQQIRKDSIDCESHELHQVLRDSVVARLTVDQPEYSGLQVARESSSASAR